MPKKSKKYSWRFYLLMLGLLGLEFLLVWEAKLLLYYRRMAGWQNGQTDQVLMGYSQRATQAEEELSQIYKRRLNSLFSVIDEDFAPLTSCSCTWLDYQAQGYALRYPEGMKVAQVQCLGEDCCGPAGVELVYPGRDDFKLELVFQTKTLEPSCQDKDCVLIHDYLTNFSEIKIGLLPTGWTQTAIDQLDGLWSENFELLIQVDSREGECQPFLRADYHNWYQRQVISGVARGLRISSLSQ